MSKSIAYLKFRTLLEEEIRTFWHLRTSLEYSQRWLNEIKTPIASLSKYPGDNVKPFTYIDISPQEYKNNQPQVESRIRENALVSFVTAFECYLLELLQRVLYIDPSLLGDSDMQIAAKEIALALPEGELSRWLAVKVADKYLRNKSHAEMIKRLDTFCKAGVSSSMKAEIEEWSRWSLVRNSIVHTMRQVTPELSKSWVTRFPTPGAVIALTDLELIRVQSLALKLAEAIDKGSISHVIKNSDELLIAREIFIHHGIDEPNELKNRLRKIMMAKVTREMLQKMLSDQKNGRIRDHWQLSIRELNYVLR